MNPSLPELSVVIPCSRPGAVARCLEGLVRQETAERFEVIVVGDVEAVGEWKGLDLTLIPCPARHANARRNLGIEKARGPRIGFLDDDAVPDPGWVEAAVRCCGPAAGAILTGPERPVATGPASRLAFAVSSSPASEGTRAHHHTRRGPIAWSEVPFCNCVVPRRWFAEVGLPSTEVPWDMDDFELFARLRGRARFESVPALAVAHDRYPDSLRAFLAYKWRLRVRTGEKLVTHPSIYARLPQVVLTAALPWAALLALLAYPKLTLLTGLAAYLVLLATQIPRARRSGRPFSFLALLAALHGTTLLGVQAGLLKGLTARLRGAARREPAGGDARGRSATV